MKWQKSSGQLSGCPRIRRQQRVGVVDRGLCPQGRRPERDRHAQGWRRVGAGLRPVLVSSEMTSTGGFAAAYLRAQSIAEMQPRGVAELVGHAKVSATEAAVTPAESAVVLGSHPDDIAVAAQIRRKGKLLPPAERWW